MKKLGAYLDYPFGPDIQVVKVKAPSQEKGRIFAQIFHLRGEPKVTLNCAPDFGEFYRRIYPNAVVRGWHCPPVQQPHFNTVSLAGSIPDEELLQMVNHSYDTAVKKLPKYAREELSRAE
ncbi:MAG: MmcQ/YjbR family DNA-binding protein [Oscillospiraceae bacterium]